MAFALFVVGILGFVSGTYAGLACPNDASKFGNKCYKYMSNDANFADASKNCVQLGGSLARIDSAEENSFVTGLLKADSWIGINDRATQGSHVWDNAPGQVTYTNWQRGEPNNYNHWGSIEHCGAVFNGWWKGQWNDFLCSDRKPYVCQFAIVDDSKLQCPLGSEFFANRCFKVVKTEMSWIDSLNHCKSLGGTLARIDNVKENSFVYSLGGKGGWFGLNDRVTEGSFRFADSAATPSYLNWNFGEPNNVFDEDCVMLESNQKWNDAGCESRRTSICQFNARTPAPAPQPAPAPSRCHWKEYANTYIAMNNNKQVKVAHEGDCKALCENETSFKCWSLEYEKAKGTCILSTIKYAEAQNKNLIRKSNAYNLYAC